MAQKCETCQKMNRKLKSQTQYKSESHSTFCESKQAIDRLAPAENIIQDTSGRTNPWVPTNIYIERSVRFVVFSTAPELGLYQAHTSFEVGAACTRFIPFVIHEHALVSSKTPATFWPTYIYLMYQHKTGTLKGIWMKSRTIACSLNTERIRNRPWALP